MNGHIRQRLTILGVIHINVRKKKDLNINLLFPKAMHEVVRNRYAIPDVDILGVGRRKILFKCFLFHNVYVYSIGTGQPLPDVAIHNVWKKETIK